jgi:putative ubiquitin-RnfH superfamily antitoxin RatB of RatAB toxin-antitoxin module
MTELEFISISIAIDCDELFCHEIPFEIQKGTSVGNALTQFSLEKNEKIDIENKKIGIFGLAVSLETILKQGDRLEIYQPLKIDPKLARRIRAKRAQDRS